jgi:glycosyltransferase involved in cell wall biosynthesis
VLFDALGALWRAGEAADARLLVVGDGPERAALEAAAADDASLRGRIGFLGDHAGVPELLPELDLVALPSRSEGLPMCLVEALAVGVPVIGSAVDGIPEVVRHGQTGLLVPPEDPGALATALAAVIADPALRVRLIDGGARHVEERYRLDGVAGRYEALFAGETVCAASPAF